jgi:hypothetical protein
MSKTNSKTAIIRSDCCKLALHGMEDSG